MLLPLNPLNRSLSVDLSLLYLCLSLSPSSPSLCILYVHMVVLSLLFCLFLISFFLFILTFWQSPLPKKKKKSVPHPLATLPRLCWSLAIINIFFKTIMSCILYILHTSLVYTSFVFFLFFFHFLNRPFWLAIHLLKVLRLGQHLLTALTVVFFLFSPLLSY